MDATPIDFAAATPLAETAFADAATRQWAALHEAAFVVATLAGVSDTADVTGFGEAVRQAPPSLRRLAEQGVEDLSAIMEPGLAALIAVHTGGGDATAPARALWQEFVAARDALAGMVAPRG